MKKYLFFHPVIKLIPVFAVLLFSCSKEKGSIATVDNKPVPEINTANRPIRGGSITGYILPEKASVKISVYNREFTSITYYYTRDGRFRFDGLPAGVYTVNVLNTETSFTVEMPSVKVQYGKVTDIGRIMIQ